MNSSELMAALGPRLSNTKLIVVANREPSGLSARNVLRGTLVSLKREGPTVVAVVESGEFFTVHLTQTAVDALALKVGAPVWLIVKTYSCRIVAS